MYTAQQPTTTTNLQVLSTYCLTGLGVRGFGVLLKSRNSFCKSQIPCCTAFGKAQVWSSDLVTYIGTLPRQRRVDDDDASRLQGTRLLLRNPFWGACFCGLLLSSTRFFRVSKVRSSMKCRARPRAEPAISIGLYALARAEDSPLLSDSGGSSQVCPAYTGISTLAVRSSY